MPPIRTRPPQLLIATNNHGPGPELLTLAERRGYMVRRVHTGAQALEQAHAAPPDIVVLDESLTDMDAFAACRALRDDPHVGPGIPLLLISAQRPSSPQHHAALRAGVWEFLRHPFNAEEIGAKLDTYVLLKLDSDRARRDTSVADASGFYTVRGLALRAHELTLQAFHHAEPLACVALAPVTTDGQNAGAVDLLAQVLRATGRRSDAIGRVGPGEFAVIAPGTDRSGAVLLAERLARAVTTAAHGGGTPPPGLRVGYDAVGNARYTPIEPKNLLARATTALRAAKGRGEPGWIQGFGG
jgi:PleD family two-component response regulator